MTIWDTLCREKQRDVNVFDLMAIGIGSSLAVGAFVVFGDLIKNLTGPAVLLSVALAAATALLGGICFTELGVQFLKADSTYVFSYSFSKKYAAFVFGWVLILQYVAGAASVAKGIVMFIDGLAENKISYFLEDYASTNFENVFVYFDFVSLAIIVIVIIILALGIKDSTTIKNIFTVCNIILVVSLIVIGSLRADINNWHTEGSEDEKSEGGFMPYGILGVTKGAAIALYGFIGFENIGVSGCEVGNRKKNIPIAVMTTIIVGFVAYIGIGAILTLMLPYYSLQEQAALPLAFEELQLVTLKWVVIIASFIGFLTSLFGASLPLPRIIQAMASDGLLFSFLDKNPLKKNVSTAAIIFGGFLTAAATGILSFQLLVSLTVLAALCVYTILAINVILTRYSRRLESENPPGSWFPFKNESSEISVKTALKNCLSFKDTITTNFTEKIVVANISLYSLGSIGLSVTFSVFSDFFFAGSAEAVAPASIFLGVMLFSLFSLIRQPKLITVLPFEVPFVPFLPCLSIFLNIFLMATFDSLTWILFSGWMALGLLFHLVYHYLSSCNGNLGKDTFYEINKYNALKLNEAIWKIKTEKKCFYEGAVNPVFTDESENMPENEMKVQNEKAILQLKQAEIIQTAEMIMEENTEPLEIGSGLQNSNFDGNSPEGSNSIHWECVAEIHSEEEFPQESVVLEIVDNTYNFLSEVSKELPRDNVSRKSIDKGKGSVGSVKESQLEETKLEETKCADILEEVKPVPTSHQLTKLKYKEDMRNPYEQIQFQDELFSKIKGRRKSIEERQEKKTLSPIIGECENKDEFVNFFIETLYETPKCEMIPRTNMQNIFDADEAKDTKIPDDYNKIKEFKEKLNQLLKNQLNSGMSPEKTFTALKTETDEEQTNPNKSEAALFGSIKTLSQAQIKGKLEILLSKGPPKRPSFRNMFKNNVKEDTEKDKSEDVNIASEEDIPPSNNDISEPIKTETTPNAKKSLNYSGIHLEKNACC